MKAAVLTGKRTIEIQDVPTPSPQKGEGLIQAGDLSLGGHVRAGPEGNWPLIIGNW